jgi:SAM-dependent methyltransferase
VSFLAARLVGPDGAVVGVDASPEAVALARARASRAGLHHVRFLVEDVANLTSDPPADALVGRMILMHLPDPAAVLRRLCDQLPAGALVVMQEPDLAGVITQPHCPLIETTVERIRETLRRVGADVRAGLRLRQVFRAAGLPEPRTILQARVEGGPDSLAYAQIADVTRTLLSPMEQTGVASADAVEIETLQARLRAELVANDATLVAPHLIGAWATR